MGYIERATTCGELGRAMEKNEYGQYLLRLVGEA